ncbi:PQQ-binding-like beta-propeller repeat protein [Planctomycetaceae bacterium]|nr:PQQ-binding-like beta-propeller repeat protein [Planctomycetaceae bacterium]
MNDSAEFNFQYQNGSDPTTEGRRIFEYTGGGVGVLDYDLDGWPDLYMTQGSNEGPTADSTESEQQIVFVEPGFVRGLEIDTGNDIWRADVIDGRDFPMIQPQQIDESSLIVATGDGKGVVRLDIEKKGAWSVQKNWQSRTLKPSFNDFLYLNGFMYGFDKQIFACIDASTGERRWKNGRFGFGQAILLESTAQLIVASEFGELVLLDADPKKFTERGRVAAMSSKTWNHPALDSGRLYVRNSEEMVCYLLAD